MLSTLLLPAAMSKAGVLVLLIVGSLTWVLIFKRLFSALGPILSWLFALVSWLFTVVLAALLVLLIRFIGWGGLILLIFCVGFVGGMIYTAPTFRF